MSDKPKPIPTSWSEHFWAELREGRFVLQRCASCGRFTGYPRVFCPHCYSDELEWVQSPGRGTIYTHSAVVANPPSTFVDELPYVIVIVQLEEGVRFLSQVIGAAPEDVTIDAAVELAITPGEDGDPMPMFRLAAAA
jgi:uncharacterized OB-fold protein